MNQNMYGIFMVDLIEHETYIQITFHSFIPHLPALGEAAFSQ